MCNFLHCQLRKQSLPSSTAMIELLPQAASFSFSLAKPFWQRCRAAGGCSLTGWWAVAPNQPFQAGEEEKWEEWKRSGEWFGQQIPRFYVVCRRVTLPPPPRPPSPLVPVPYITNPPPRLTLSAASNKHWQCDWRRGECRGGAEACCAGVRWRDSGEEVGGGCWMHWLMRCSRSSSRRRWLMEALPLGRCFLLLSFFLHAAVPRGVAVHEYSRLVDPAPQANQTVAFAVGRPVVGEFAAAH